MHAHRCRACRYLFMHSDDAYDDEAQHMCPRCHAGPYWVIHKPQAERLARALVLLMSGVLVLAAVTC